MLLTRVCTTDSDDSLLSWSRRRRESSHGLGSSGSANNIHRWIPTCKPIGPFLKRLPINKLSSQYLPTGTPGGPDDPHQHQHHHMPHSRRRRKLCLLLPWASRAGCCRPRRGWSQRPLPPLPQQQPTESRPRPRSESRTEEGEKRRCRRRPDDGGVGGHQGRQECQLEDTEKRGPCLLAIVYKRVRVY